MSTAVQILGLNGQDVVGIQVGSHLQQELSNEYLLVVCGHQIAQIPLSTMTHEDSHDLCIHKHTLQVSSS